MGQVHRLETRRPEGGDRRAERQAARLRRAFNAAGQAVCAESLGSVGARGPAGLSITTVGHLAELFRAVPGTGTSVWARVDRLAVLLAGRAAEELLGGDLSAGAEAELARALALARTMAAEAALGEWATSATIVSRDHGRLHPAGTGLGDDVDTRARVLVARAEARARTVVQANRAVVGALATELAAAGQVEGDTLMRLLALVRSEAAVGTSGRPTWVGSGADDGAHG